MYTTNRAYPVAPEFRSIPPYKRRHPSVFFSSTRSAHLRPLALRPFSIFITSQSQKAEPRENVSQCWFSVFVYFSHWRLTIIDHRRTLPQPLRSFYRYVDPSARLRQAGLPVQQKTVGTSLQRNRVVSITTGKILIAALTLQIRPSTVHSASESHAPPIVIQGSSQCLDHPFEALKNILSSKDRRQLLYALSVEQASRTIDDLEQVSAKRFVPTVTDLHE